MSDVAIAVFFGAIFLGGILLAVIGKQTVLGGAIAILGLLLGGVLIAWDRDDQPPPTPTVEIQTPLSTNTPEVPTPSATSTPVPPLTPSATSTPIPPPPPPPPPPATSTSTSTPEQTLPPVVTPDVEVDGCYALARDYQASVPDGFTIEPRHQLVVSFYRQGEQEQITVLTEGIWRNEAGYILGTTFDYPSCPEDRVSREAQQHAQRRNGAYLGFNQAFTRVG